MPGWNAGRRGSGKPEKAKETEFSGVAVVQGEELVQEPTVSVGVPVARSSLTVDVSEAESGSAALVPTSAAFDDAVRPRKKRITLRNCVKAFAYSASILVHFIDFGSDVSLYFSMKSVADDQAVTAAAAHADLARNSSSRYNLSSVLAVNASIAGSDVLCDPQAAAARLASPDWQWTPGRLSALALASLISIAVSIIPLLVALYLMSKKLRAAIKGGEPAPEVGVPWVKRPEARALLLSTTFLVQILEDVPQSVIGSLFVSTMLAKAGANCDSCFFDNAPAGVSIDDPSCYVLQVEKVSEAASRTISWMSSNARSEFAQLLDAASHGSVSPGFALIFSITMTCFSVLKGALISGAFAIFSSAGGRIPRPRFCREEHFCCQLACMPVALLLFALWVVAYFCFALSPLAGVLYIDVFPAIELPNAEAFAPLLVGTMVIGGLGWVAAIVAIVLACCALCGC